MTKPIRRRDFLRATVAAGLGLTAHASGTGGVNAGNFPFIRTSRITGSTTAWSQIPEKLNIGIIGVAHRGGDNLNGVKDQNIVALCDIDDRLLGGAAAQFPKAKTYNDFRKLLAQKDLDAVVVSTADHVHAPASLTALRLGKHVYCEKPMSHTVREARLVAEEAKKRGLATQHGTQIHAVNNYRRVVELIRAGVIGPVRECHVWVEKTWSGGERPKQGQPTPKHIHWDLWVGPAPDRPYHPTYMPANWRRWWDFGSGTLGDMACHYMDLPFWALDLKYPTEVSADGPPVHPETAPDKLAVHYTFPARGKEPLVKLSWYDGGRRPEILNKPEMPRWGDGVLFVGDKGMLLADYGRYQLLPEKTFRGFTPPKQTIPDSVGHYREWIDACKTGSPTSCNFGYASLLTETVLLGNVAYRLGKTLRWDGANAKAIDCPEAEAYLQKEYRKGWELHNIG